MKGKVDFSADKQGGGWSHGSMQQSSGVASLGPGGGNNFELNLGFLSGGRTRERARIKAIRDREEMEAPRKQASSRRSSLPSSSSSGF